jgi:hypothetical protein
MKVAFIFGPGGANEDPAGVIADADLKGFVTSQRPPTGPGGP